MLASLLFFLPAAAMAEEPDPLATDYEETVGVEARVDDLVGIADSATEGVTGQEDLAGRPKLRPGELVETVPGMIATQHSGGGKANQYFLRGFNLDHGTDFRTSVDGMLVNLPTHGHGQGYTDLSFLIPALVETARFRKGPYDAGFGDFAAAGSVDFELVRKLPAPALEVTGGRDGYGRIFAAGSREAAGGDLLGALDVHHQDGPWERPDDYRRAIAVLRFSRGDLAKGYALTFLGHSGRWNATDQVPVRAVASGQIGLYGNLDPDLGGRTARNSLSFRSQRSDGTTSTQWSAFVLDYRFRLLSNFTYFLDDPVNGDEFLQEDERQALGGRFDREGAARWGAREVRWRAGAELRTDFIDNGLFRTTAGDVRGTIRSDDVRQTGAGTFADASVHWLPWLRTRIGLRWDGFDARVQSDLDANSGTRRDSLLSPKLSVALGPWRASEVYLNFGQGHHSNDARGATIRVDPVTGQAAERVVPLVRARGFDVGFRTTAVPGLQSTVSLFRLDLASELVFVGDAGATEAGRPTRRTGIEMAAFWRVLPWLALDLDAAFSHGRFTDDDPAGDRIPGSIESAVAAGATVS
jgi:hypothetical protein